MNAHTKIRVRPHYAGKIAVRRAVETAKACGINIGGIDLQPDGTIRLFDHATAIAVALRDLQKD